MWRKKIFSQQLCVVVRKFYCSLVKVHGEGKFADIMTNIRSREIDKILVMGGAGISTPSGLPDFRTPASGLYDSIKLFNLPDPTAVFDINVFRADPRPFFQVAKDLYPGGSYRPNYVHHFIRLLEDLNLLVKMYTQNIDGLERLAGVSEERLVEAHGTFSTATCQSCGEKYKGEAIKDDIFADRIPRCTVCKGVIKPDIVFFGENLPDNFYTFPDDFSQAQLVIIMGTSLEVYPFAGIADASAWDTPRILVNKEVVGPFVSGGRPNDVTLEGDVVEGTKMIAKEMDIHKLIQEPLR